MYMCGNVYCKQHMALGGKLSTYDNFRVVDLGEVLQLDLTQLAMPPFRAFELFVIYNSLTELLTDLDRREKQSKQSTARLRTVQLISKERQ